MVKTRNCRASDIHQAYALQNSRGRCPSEGFICIGPFFAPYAVIAYTLPESEEPTEGI